MTDKIICPWCGAEMKIYDYALNSSYYIAYAECTGCGAYGPNEISKKNAEMAKQAAHAAALRRYTPPLKPMTLEEAIDEMAVWIESKTNEPENELTPSLFGWQNEGRWVVFIGRPGEDDDDVGEIVGYNPLDYGRAWRCWERKPTDEERSAAGWET